VESTGQKCGHFSSKAVHQLRSQKNQINKNYILNCKTPSSV